MTTPDQNLKNTVKKMMERVRTGRLPGSEEIVRQTFAELGYDHRQLTPAETRAQFNDILFSAFQHTLTVLERYEAQAYSEGIPAELLKLRPDRVEEAERINRRRGFRFGAESLMSALYLELREAFLSVSQSRKTRGGRDFELQFEQALTFAGFPFEKQKRRTRVDFMMPSDTAFERNRTICAVASLKRTLRERWREVVAELYELHAPNVFLITADSAITAGHVESICDTNHLHLVVWDSVKTSFPNHHQVLSFTQFANERLPHLNSIWATAGLT